jgi:lipopolysaccharide transport system ATP-binding protein
MSIVVRVENVSKIYKLGLIGSNTLAGDLADAFARIRGKESQEKKLNAENEDGSIHVALQDVTFDVKEGEVLGIIGKNGAGKSTLLKILSSITSPTTGTIKMKGRVASLLEVGTGFHPELSGRENIFLNGAILGMLRSEVTSKFDEIVDFSGVAKFIDTPVKRYSSGMYVRLAFAVAAHLEPEILIVDEVLSVGDADFQKKSIGKMKDVAANQGRTVLFVSHTIKALQALCQNGLMLQNGKIVKTGPIKEVTDFYLGGSDLNYSLSNEWTRENAHFAEGVYLLAAKIKNEEVIYRSDRISLSFKMLFETKKKFHLSFHLFNKNEDYIFNCMSEIMDFEAGEYLINFEIPGGLLNEGGYVVHLNFVENGSTLTLNAFNILAFEVKAIATEGISWYGQWPGIVRPEIFTESIKI